MHNAALRYGSEAWGTWDFLFDRWFDQSDSIYRLEVARFGQMLDTPRAHRFPQFAGHRVRSAEVVVELEERRPTRVVRMTHCVLTFDQAGFSTRRRLIDTSVSARRRSVPQASVSRLACVCRFRVVVHRRSRRLSRPSHGYMISSVLYVNANQSSFSHIDHALVD